MAEKWRRAQVRREGVGLQREVVEPLWGGRPGQRLGKRGRRGAWLRGSEDEDARVVEPDEGTRPAVDAAIFVFGG